MIYLTVCYFGTFPNYFQLYLDSLKINADIFKIILITDIDLSKYKIPTNVIHFNLSLDEIRERAKLFFLNEYHNVVPLTDIIKKPYKLCDYKVIYHILFADIYNTLKINETDHVGWTDIDVIHGKLSSFLELKNNYDILGIQGHFTAIKNITKYINVYKLVNRLFDRLLDERSLFVDENTFIDTFMDLFKPEINVFKMYNYHCDISPHIKELTMAGREREIIKHLQRDAASGKLIIHFLDGRTQETSYCHLQKRTMNVEFDVNSYKDTYYITFDSFVRNCPVKNDVLIPSVSNYSHTPSGCGELETEGNAVAVQLALDGICGEN